MFTYLKQTQDKKKKHKTNFTAFFQKTFNKSFQISYKYVKVKVEVTLVQALRLCTGRTAHRGSRGIALPFHDHGTRSG